MPVRSIAGEEQPLQNALVGSYVGDMPTTGQRECIRYTRTCLRLKMHPPALLAGITNGELAPRKEYISLQRPRASPSQPAPRALDHGQGWRLKFERESGPCPNRFLCHSLASHFHFTHIEGAHSHSENDLVLVDNSATHWTAFWKA